MCAPWNDIVEKVFGKGTTIVFPRFFISKKNQVTLLNMERNGRKFRAVAKFFVWGDAQKEWDILKKSCRAGLNVPEPIDIYENIIFTKFIPGKSLKAISESESSELPVENLARWLADFHRAFKDGEKTLLKGDVMLPNFIYQPESGSLFGVDFEECVVGREIMDVSDILTTLLVTGDSFSGENIERTRRFAWRYRQHHPIPISSGEIRDFIIETLHRRISYMPVRRDEFLKYVDLIGNINFKIF